MPSNNHKRPHNRVTSISVAYERGRRDRGRRISSRAVPYVDPLMAAAWERGFYGKPMEGKKRSTSH